MIWHMEMLKIYLEEWIKHSILLNTHSMMDIKEVLLQWFTFFFYFFIYFFFFWLKGLLLRVKINLLLTQEHKLILILKTNNQQKNYISRLLENINNVKYTLLLKTTFGSADLADTQLISEYNKGIQFLFCVTDFFSKYAWVVPSKDKKDTIITNDFQKFSNQKSVTQTKYWYTKVVSFTINQ